MRELSITSLLHSLFKRKFQNLKLSKKSVRDSYEIDREGSQKTLKGIFLFDSAVQSACQTLEE